MFETSLINYADLISREPCANEKIIQYAEVLHRQSKRLKRLIEDLIEASKAATGNIEINLASCEANILLIQAAGKYAQESTRVYLSLERQKNFAVISFKNTP